VRRQQCAYKPFVSVISEEVRRRRVKNYQNHSKDYRQIQPVGSGHIFSFSSLVGTFSPHVCLYGVVSRVSFACVFAWL
jgi:hypothetical protein